MKQETKCLHSGYVPKNGEPRQMPIYQSTTFKYDSSDAKLIFKFGADYKSDIEN